LRRHHNNTGVVAIAIWLSLANTSGYTLLHWAGYVGVIIIVITHIVVVGYTWSLAQATHCYGHWLPPLLILHNSMAIGYTSYRRGYATPLAINTSSLAIDNTLVYLRHCHYQYVTPLVIGHWLVIGWSYHATQYGHCHWRWPLSMSLVTLVNNITLSPRHCHCWLPEMAIILVIGHCYAYAILVGHWLVGANSWLLVTLNGYCFTRTALRRWHNIIASHWLIIVGCHWLYGSSTNTPLALPWLGRLIIHAITGAVMLSCWY